MLPTAAIIHRARAGRDQAGQRTRLRQARSSALSRAQSVLGELKEYLQHVDVQHLPQPVRRALHGWREFEAHTMCAAGMCPWSARVFAHGSNTDIVPQSLRREAEHVVHQLQRLGEELDILRREALDAKQFFQATHARICQQIKVCEAVCAAAAMPAADLSTLQSVDRFSSIAIPPGLANISVVLEYVQGMCSLLSFQRKRFDMLCAQANDMWGGITDTPLPAAGTRYVHAVPGLLIASDVDSDNSDLGSELGELDHDQFE